MPSLGEELKRQRELREISLREISNATKISIRILEAIENNNFKILPGGIFNRNFLRAYALFIGLDPEQIVRKYQQQTDRADGNAVAVMPPELSGTLTEKKGHAKVWIYALIGVLIVAGAVLYFFFRPRM